ncbi:hypothetical protein HPB47_001212 [Ixodes persulcatus]|uniref:Uncharacterized protein n=1 Tax=Ixodes persulcatus TaxID=34615 RepID=A0AC60PQC8_IXOPE|nr:hypothetical protein HPB47_001212 [Ixodes persulcatus]
MEKRDAVGDSANVTENSPIAGAGNGCLAGRHADEASSTADVTADRSARPYDRGETIEDILLELNATSRSAVPAPVETPQVPGEESDRDSTCDKKTESIASSGCGAHALEEDDLRNPGVDPEPRSSEIDYDDYIVADEASADEGATQDDSATKDENEDRVSLPPALGNDNSEEKNECSEAAAASSEKAGDTEVAETVKVTQLDSPVKSIVGSLESGGVKESKMSSGPVSEVPGTPRRTGRQRNAPQRLADGTEKRSPERKHNGPQKPAAEAAAAQLLAVDQNHHAEAVPNGNLAGQTYKVSSGKQHLTKAQRKLMVDDEVPALPKQVTPRKRASKLAVEGTAVPPEASVIVQPEIFSDDDNPLIECKTKASPRGKRLTKVQSQGALEDQTSASPKKGTPRKRVATPAVEQVTPKAPTNGDETGILSDSDVPLVMHKTRPSPRAKQPPKAKQQPISPKKGTLGKRATTEEALLSEIAATDAQAEVFSDEDAPLAKRRKKQSSAKNMQTKVQKQLALEKLPSALPKRGTSTEHASRSASHAPSVAYSTVQPDLLSDDDEPLNKRKTKASPKKQAVRARKQLTLEEQSQVASGRAAPKKRQSNVDAGLEVSSPPRKELEVKTKGKRQRTAADKDLELPAAAALGTQSNENQKPAIAKMQQKAGKSVRASKKPGQVKGLPNEPGEQPMEHADVVQEKQATLETNPLQQEHPAESPSSSPRPRCISGSLQKQDLWTLRDSPSWRAEQFVSSDRLLRETVCLGLREREATTGPAFLTIEVPSSGLDPRRCWGPKSARRRPTVVFGGCDPYKMYVNVHGTRVLLQQWSQVANITPTVRLTDMFATFSLK